jgi:hypothetical protein
MAQVVPLNWQGSFGGYAGPLNSGDSANWFYHGSVVADPERFVLVSVSCEGNVAGTLEVQNLSHFRTTNPDGTIYDRTEFDIVNVGSDAPVFYFWYVAWSDAITV